MVGGNEWVALGLSSPLMRRAATVVSAPVIGKLESLPFESLSWEDFERIQWRILHDVEGLRHALIYGERGQDQQGLDIVALEPDGTGVALQSKRYRKFGPAELEAAVKRFRTTKRPFDVQRLIIGVAREVRSTNVVTALATHRKTLAPIELELWDKRRLSDLLRDRPAIVIEFFGTPTAEAFCFEFSIDPIKVPAADAAAVREALARTPEESTGAGDLFRQAEAIPDRPAAALDLVERGQALLVEAGFRAHAARREEQRATLLTALDRAGEAARRALDEAWAAVDQGLGTNAEIAARRVEEIAAGAPSDTRAAALAKAANVLIDTAINPLGAPPSLSSIAVGEPSDQARLAILGGETALAADDRDWLDEARPTLSALTAVEPDALRLTRLRLLVAEADDDWTALLEDARKLRLGYELSALVAARYARRCARIEEFEEADLNWDDAAGAASLARRWEDASTWVFSRRAYRVRWRILLRDELLPIEVALGELDASPPPLLPTSARSYTQALEELRVGKLRPAAIAAQRALRMAIAGADWFGEERARRVLAAVLLASDEPRLAAHHYALAGDTSGIADLAAAEPRTYIDVTAELDGPNYWTVGTAFRLVAAQADLLPDEAVEPILARIRRELDAADGGTLRDVLGFATSRYLGALKALAGLAERLDAPTAGAILAHFERQPAVEPGRYRLYDEDEALTVAGIALTQSDLRERAITHLVPLLARSNPAQRERSYRPLNRHFATAQPHLTALAVEGNRWAQEMLAAHEVAETPQDAVEVAFTRLATPLQHTPGVHTLGTSAVGDSLLLLKEPSERLDQAVSELLARADDSQVALSDRGDYLLAAANLAVKLPEDRRAAHYPAALRIAASPAESEFDQANAAYAHKLSSFRVNPSPDSSRYKALLLAATLAADDAQRAEIKQQVYSLLSPNDGAESWAARVLQRLGDTAKDDLGFLAGQGWGLRSLAAILWVDRSTPAHVGLRLAVDDDPRVRRALASSLATAADQAAHAEVRDILARDPAYSVRAALRGVAA